MNVLLIREYPKIDGTFTLLLRIAKSLKKDGHTPYFLLLNRVAVDIENEIRESATLFYHEDLLQLYRQNALPAIDAIHGILSGDALYYTYRVIKKRLFPDAGMVIGIYHPRTYVDKSRIGFTPDSILYKKFLRSVPEQNIVFMNDAVKQSMEKIFARKFVNSPVIPLPVSIPPAYIRRAKVKRNKIVSIGRLVPFKSYVLAMLAVIRTLKEEQRHFEFHIYGAGSLQFEIEKQIQHHALEDRVFLKGELPYADVSEVLSDAFLFVGMGTSIVEACSWGVPSLLAIESNLKPTSYGFFHRLNGYTVGEVVPEWQEVSLLQSIREVASLNEEAYETICRQSYERSLDFSEDKIMKSYYEFYRKADTKFTFIVPKWKQILLKILRQPFKPFLLEE